MTDWKAKSIEIVSHVYDPPGLDVYSQLLKWQFASLYHNPPPVPTTLTVCYTREDAKTTAMVKQIGAIIDSQDCEPVTLRALDFPPGSLFRRAVGRNFCALQSPADVIWFTDVDYCFGPSCLRAVAELTGLDTQLVMPAHVQISTNHGMGDEDVFYGRDVDLPKIDPARFSERRQRICIGGVQIVGGHLARKIGYLHGTKWVKPVPEDAGFRSCRGDKAFRRLNKLAAERIKIPSVYRLRHSRDGRDFNQSGTIIGKKVW